MITSKNADTLTTYYKNDTKENKEAYIRVIDIIDIRNSIQNERLQKAAKEAGIKTHITMHVARHTFATHLRSTTNSIHIIKDALGHSSTQQTEEYLKELQDEILDVEMDRLYGK